MAEQKSSKQRRKAAEDTERIRRTVVMSKVHMATGSGAQGADLVTHLREPFRSIVLYGERSAKGLK